MAEGRSGTPRQRGTWRRGIVLAIACLAVADGAVALACVRPPELENAAVAAAMGPTTLELESGRALHLQGITVPPEWRAAARAALQELAVGRRVAFLPAGEPDRYARTPVDYAEPRGGEWLQGALVDSGLALVRPSADARGCTAPLLARERLARRGRHGLWAGGVGVAARADEPATLMRQVGRFVIVEGRVLSVGERRVRTYLNFGTYWNEDFTVIIARRDEAGFVDRLGPLGELAGRVVRVRGWIRDDRGPAIKADYPEQIEIVDDG